MCGAGVPDSSVRTFTARYLILTTGFQGKDGISCLSRQIARALGKMTSEAVEVWSLDRAGSPPGAAVRFRPSGGSRIRLIIRSLVRALHSCRTTTIVVMHAHLSPLCLLMRLRGARVLQVLHGVEVWKKLSPLQSLAFRKSDRLVCVSCHSAQRFENANPSFKRVVVCHPGLPDRPGVAHSEDNSPAFALIVGRMSSEERYKGHDVLLEEWPEVLKRVRAARLTVAGGGDDSDRLLRKAEALGVAESVRFVGEVTDDALEKLYRECAFFVMPSRNEGFGLVFLEAMRAGKPCIGGQGAASEIIVHETTGFVVAPGDRAELRDAIVHLAQSSELRRRMGVAARKRFEERFNDRSFEVRWLEVLESAGG